MHERLCADCGRPFVLGRAQAERYAARGWAPPRRCPACRTARRAGPRAPGPDAPTGPPPPVVPPPPAGTPPPAGPPPGGDAGPGPGDGSGWDSEWDPEDPPDVPPAPPPVEAEAGARPGGAVDVQCAACGAPTRVTFTPTARRPVYCRACFELR